VPLNFKPFGLPEPS